MLQGLKGANANLEPIPIVHDQKKSIGKCLLWQHNTVVLIAFAVRPVEQIDVKRADGAVIDGTEILLFDLP